ncbi:hypothetical protein SPB21_15145 [Leptothoe sp. ISB3NOV94-8A]
MFLKSRQLKKLIKVKAQLPSQVNDSGLTLIEGLVAIVIIAITTAVMTPMVILAVGTRVQSQRAEQAFQIAQAEVDRIKVIVERGGDYTLNIALAPTGVNSVADFDVVPVPAPITINNNNYARNLRAARGISTDDDATDDEYAVQIFRTEGITRGTKPVAFDLGVRVYRADVVDGGPLGVEQARLAVTSGEGQSGSRPLANIYTSITESDSEQSLCDYHDFINSVTGSTTPKPPDC